MRSIGVKQFFKDKHFLVLYPVNALMNDGIIYRSKVPEQEHLRIHKNGLTIYMSRYILPKIGVVKIRFGIGKVKLPKD